MEEPEYREFRVTVVNPQTIQVVRGGILVTPPPHIPMDRLRERTINVLSRHLASGQVAKKDELTVLGSHLFEGLFDDKVQELFAKERERVRSRDNSILRLILEFSLDARYLAEMPWEYLYYPDSDQGKGYFIAADTESRLILARHVPLRPEFEDLEASPSPLRILIVLSQPQKFPEGVTPLGRVVADDVIADIKALEAESNGAIKVDELDQPSKRSLEERIGAFKPHVVHFLGHGKYEPGAGGALAMVNDHDRNTLEWVPDEDLPDLFNPPPRLVFLHACLTGHSESYEAFRGVALQLVYSRVPAVVAMQYEIENSVASKFAHKFYESLAHGKPIDAAVQDGRRELGMYLEGASFSSRAFGSPVVFLQRADGIIQEGAPVVERPSEVQPDSAQLRCPKCDRNVSAAQSFCIKCQTQLRSAPRCRKCSQYLPAEAEFCPDCGTPTEADKLRAGPESVAAPGAQGSDSAFKPTSATPVGKAAVERRAPAVEEKRHLKAVPDGT